MTSVATGPDVRPRDRVGPRDHPRRRRLRWVVLAVVVLLVAAGAWLALRAVQLASVLGDVGETARELQQAADDADAERASALVPVLQEQTADAVALTDDPLWSLAGGLPVLGDDVRAVTTVSTALDDLARDALPPLARAAGAVSPEALRPVDGRVDLAPVTASAPDLRTAAEGAREAADAVAAIETDSLVAALSDRLAPLVDGLEQMADQLSGMADVADLMPPLLGADGPRAYLVLAVNPAELRSSGGIVGSVVRVTADDGALTLVSHRAARELPQPAVPLPLSEEETTLHSERLGRFVQNVTETPDFPRTAALAADLWELDTGERVDGVLAVDPRTLSYLLEATGPLPGPDGTTLEAGTIVDLLLAEAYGRYPDPDASDDFFAEASATAFGVLTRGEVDPGALIAGVRRAATEQRVRLWSADPDEQAVLVGTEVGGAFLTGGQGRAVGVFLSDRTEAKMGYYLSSDISVESVTCGAVGVTATVAVELRSDAPADAADLPEQVTGDGATGVPAGSVRTAISVYTPVGGGFGEAVLVQDGEEAVVGGTRATAEGRAVQVFTAELAPGESVTYLVDVVLAPRTWSGDVVLRSTPTLTSTGPVTSPVTCE